MLHVYNCILLKMSTWGSKHVEENSIVWINNNQCIKLVINIMSNFPPFIELEFLWLHKWPPIDSVKTQLRSVHMYSCKTYFNTSLSIHTLVGLPCSLFPLCLVFWIECSVHVSYLPSHALRFIHSKRYLSFSSPTPHRTRENELRSRVNTSMGVNFLSGWFNRG